ncbi:hypothetical protein BHE90_006155 [Fusarium euwallaceae]|uniref:argininosuccinate synthase n=1 Tax=Fusarium euwallaceae TaxID=1147111 RepID=A0A430LUF0_9HYPO|nr:hypothetical protein BHE90_006155 [Fusarium euwallaceae]
MDSKVRIIRDRLSDDWAQCIYNARSPFSSSSGMYFTPEREFVQQAISISQKQVDGKVEALAYKDNVIIVGRSSETSNLYSEEESSMDTLDMDWSVEDTTGFINVNAIRIAKYGERKIRDGEPLSKPCNYTACLALEFALADDEAKQTTLAKKAASEW